MPDETASAREAFCTMIGKQLHPLIGVTRIQVEFAEHPPDGPGNHYAEVVVDLAPGGEPLEVQGALARMQRRYRFEVRIVRDHQRVTLLDDHGRGTRKPSIWSVGTSFLGAIEGLELAAGLDPIGNCADWPATPDELGRGFDWGASFTSDGTSFKAAGRKIECGASASGFLYTVTWWK